VIAALRSPLAVGIIAFFVALITISSFMGPTRCKSGWASASIGRRGACSHHGGVDHTPGTLLALGSLGIGLAAGMMKAKYDERRSRKHEDPIERPTRRRSSFEASSAKWQKQGDTDAILVRPPGAGTECPRCGTTMRAIAQDGRIVLKCPAPDCGTRTRYR
jgi:hypothetical protein